jgi:3-demethoxyubiquinol 3-hydroxylase
MIDHLIAEFDKGLRTVFGPSATQRPVPGADIADADMSDAERSHVASLMRVNHCGEICAQALYQGQALTSRRPETRQALQRAALEETEHLHWTEQRIADLGGRKSLLNPLWYTAALTLGIVAGKLGDRWNLGFLAETERQVEQHLSDHLGRLPPQDRRSRAIVEQMRADESGHAAIATRLGGRELPAVAKLAMKMSSRVMTQTAYYL